MTSTVLLVPTKVCICLITSVPLVLSTERKQSVLRLVTVSTISVSYGQDLPSIQGLRKLLIWNTSSKHSQLNSLSGKCLIATVGIFRSKSKTKGFGNEYAAPDLAVLGAPLNKANKP